MKKSVKLKNIRNFNPVKNKRIGLLLILVFGLVGLLAIRLISAAPYDGYQRIRIVNTAAAEIGHFEWDSRVLEYSEGNRENWCADFVSWVYMKAGYAFNTSPTTGKSGWRIPVVYKQSGSVPNLRDYLIQNSAYKTRESGYTPAQGDIVIFARAGRSHTGIIERVDRPANKNENWIYTIEGNTDTNNVARRSYPMSDASIDGYGVIISTGPNPTPAK